MSRKIKVISGLALVTALTNVGNLVEADEQTQAAKEVSIANQPASEQVVSDAKSKADAANQALSQQESVVNKTEQDLAQNQKQLEDNQVALAQAESNAQPDVLQKAEEDVKATQDAVSLAQENQTSAQTLVENAQKQVQAEEVSNTVANTAVADAQMAVQKAQDTLDAMSDNTLDVKTAQDELAKKEAAEKVAQEELAKANQAVEEADAKVAEVQKAQLEAAKPLTLPATPYEVPDDVLADIEKYYEVWDIDKRDKNLKAKIIKRLDEAYQKQYEQKQKEAQIELPQVKLSPEWVSAYKAYKAATNPEDKANKLEKLQSLGIEESAQLIRSLYSESNDIMFTTLFNFASGWFEEDFGPEISTILGLGNQYAAQLINSIRQQLGIDGTVVINQDSVVLAEALKSEDMVYETEGYRFGPLNGFDSSFVKEIYDYMGLKTDGDRGGQHVAVIGEHHGRVAVFGYDMGGFLRTIYTHIVWPILEHPQENKLASAVLLNPDKILLGLSETPFNLKGSWDGIHLALLSESDVADSSKFDVTANLTAPVPSLTAAKKAQEQAQKAQKSAQDAYKQAQEQTKAAQGEVTKAQTAQTATAESIALAKEHLAEQKEKLQAAQEELTKTTVNLAKAKAKLESAQAALERANKELAAKQAEASSAQTKLTEVKGASTQVVMLKERLSKIQEQIIAQTDTLTSAKAELADLKVKATDAQEYYQLIKSIYDLQHKPSDKSVKSTVEGQKGQVMPLAQSNKSSNHELTQKSSVEVKQTYSRVAQRQSLPKTGEEGSLLYLAGLSLLGIAVSHRKKFLK
ncbi:SEC10/PgrA surface exclusion domain-containing protein [Streptococcus parasuis]|uniref:SEC10/PgrA surface exclusion domain-containing protein n=1 Tax=Streptococcus parasuis TaxID=1501662 RepID=UPI00240D840A|nr:SEC10/PgrA surface exclusion domain-containing protein [Streptococcus parasuis]WFB92143.1 SEC10/PgrA surface exclusion domain-containing protein [Streptococcus parasuis]